MNCLATWMNLCTRKYMASQHGRCFILSYLISPHSTLYNRWQSLLYVVISSFRSVLYLFVNQFFKNYVCVLSPLSSTSTWLGMGNITLWWLKLLYLQEKVQIIRNIQIFPCIFSLVAHWLKLGGRGHTSHSILSREYQAPTHFRFRGVGYVTWSALTNTKWNEVINLHLSNG